MANRTIEELEAAMTSLETYVTKIKRGQLNDFAYTALLGLLNDAHYRNGYDVGGNNLDSGLASRAYRIAEAMQAEFDRRNPKP